MEAPWKSHRRGDDIEVSMKFSMEETCFYESPMEVYMGAPRKRHGSTIEKHY